MIFDKKKRTAQEPKSRIETQWDYLDNSGRDVAQRVRDLLNFWIKRYPESERKEMIARFRSGNDQAFKSATFELLLFAAFRSLGCAIEIHPMLPNGNLKRPDFLIQTPNGEIIYVEAVLASEYSAEEIAAQKRTNEVLHAIEKVDSPNFFITVNTDSHPDRPLGSKKLRKELKQWLGSLDPDVVIREINEHGNNAKPSAQFNIGDWSITFGAIPKLPDKRGRGQRSIGAEMGNVRWVNIWEPVRDAVKDKGSKYGKLPHPFLVAVNIDDSHVDRIDEMEALFGQEEFVLQRNDLSKEPEMRRKPNGVWHSGSKPQHTRVSGTWFFSNLNIWNIASRKHTIYLNPWAKKPLPDFFMRLPHARSKEGEMGWVEGMPLWEILGLPQEWPEKDRIK